MEHPVREIGSIIQTLTTGSPGEQLDTLNKFFVSDASFTHPFCHVPSFKKGTIPFARNIDSRWILLCIYRWYRTLSPTIDITIESAVFNQSTNCLFVNIHQTFAVWFVPLYRADVSLITVLKLEQRTSQSSNGTTALSGPGQERAKYYISSQEDFYQMNDCVQFLVPRVGQWLWRLWQLFSTWLCVVLSLMFLPVYYTMNSGKAAKKVT
ncbi:flavin-binding monooxygenase-like protein [Pochonia chlamydosporia 170]|uniref:Flavin-binding monooxygenase-like protein n=1 Tax=Pochonia chlamydosporia 170 TaxID=1380566 RepID=A0A179F6Y7_METCM|nr:flavin-binding monooxygenase-like protein [Pochonia chlamydosporia 170]OAQ61172.1 flavin-binding monooxygenase-like protein [Pochonia chlamydosporia 170]